MNKHLEVRVEVNPAWVEFVSEILLIDIGCSGTVISELEYKDEVVTKEEIDIVKGYLWFNDENPVDKIKIQEIISSKHQELINQGVDGNSLGSWSLTFVEIEDEEWAHNWKKFWHPQKISNKIVICPSWEEYNATEEEIIINLDPGTAFGTGTHPTTRLCVQGLEKHLQQGATLADIGTGSGILAICGIKLGAKEAVGVDNDLSVIHVAQENADKNAVGDKCKFFEGSASDITEKFDIITANILANILIEMMDDLVKLLKPNAKIIFSGIIAQKADDVKKSAIESGLIHIENLVDENWVAIIMEKPL